MAHSRILLPLIVLLFPAVAFAHATPIEMQPISGARLTDAPTEIRIRFSEHLESGSSRIRVTDAAGLQLQTGNAMVGPDGRTLHVPVSNEQGIYTVSWSVVSKDDGHFTRGSYAYSVNSSAALPSTDEEVVQIATSQEAGLMFVEFLGNSLLWGVLALYALSSEPRLRRMFALLALVAGVLGLYGAAGQLLLKSQQLAGLHGIGPLEGLQLYVHTVAGYSTVIRGIALSLAGLLGAWLGFRSVRMTTVVLGVPLVVFALFRALVSHATANPFYPALSIAVNVVHVIEKDLWLGALLVICVLMASRIREHVVPALIPRMFSLLSANLAVLALTACYIVWLHLKSLSNITTTNWGAAFVPLLVSALFLVALHILNVYLARSKLRLTRTYLATTIGAQTASAVLVVFFTSVVIITSPPSHTALHVLHSTDGDTTVSLSRAPYEDDMALLVIEGASAKPTVMLGAHEGGLMPAVEQRFSGGYVFPVGLIPQQPTPLYVSVARSHAYDAQASFTVSAQDFAIPHGHGRTFDRFTITMILIASFGVVFSILLVRFGRLEAVQIDMRLAGSRAFVGGVAVCLVILIAVLAASRALSNRYQARCVSDGNMWHLMQPTVAGKAVSGETREGCMWGMGQYSYMFADPREYDYLSSLGPAAVTMRSVPAPIRASIPTNLTFTLTNADGSPATLLVDMEKLLHVVIVSKDQSVFAHIHPDDIRAITQSEIDRSTFTVRYTFPKAGEYLVSVDYAHGTQLESKQFHVEVVGGPRQARSVRTYASDGVFSGYTVSMDARDVFAGDVSTLKFSVAKDGEPVVDMEPYLAAVSHISVVKNDLTAFIHTHGEIHPPGVPYPPVVVRDGKVIHSMSSMIAPAAFGPAFESHVVFPTSGHYTVWAQIKVHGVVIPASFTLDVQ